MTVFEYLHICLKFLHLDSFVNISTLRSVGEALKQRQQAWSLNVAKIPFQRMFVYSRSQNGAMIKQEGSMMQGSEH